MDTKPAYAILNGKIKHEVYVDYFGDWRFWQTRVKDDYNLNAIADRYAADRTKYRECFQKFSMEIGYSLSGFMELDCNHNSILKVYNDKDEVIDVFDNFSN